MFNGGNFLKYIADFRHLHHVLSTAAGYSIPVLEDISGGTKANQKETGNYRATTPWKKRNPYTRHKKVSLLSPLQPLLPPPFLPSQELWIDTRFARLVSGRALTSSFLHSRDFHKKTRFLRAARLITLLNRRTAG